MEKYSYKIPIFLSYPKPHLKIQQEFIDGLREYLNSRGILGRTLGITDYGIKAPLNSVRGMLMDCNGVITIAFARTLIEKAIVKPNNDIEKGKQVEIENKYITSPWCHIEAAMAYQIGLPVLVLREKGVLVEGVIEDGVVGGFIPEFNLENPTNKFLESDEWHQIIGQWESHVRNVVENKSKPPKLF